MLRFCLGDNENIWTLTFFIVYVGGVLNILRHSQQLLAYGALFRLRGYMRGEAYNSTMLIISLSAENNVAHLALKAIRTTTEIFHDIVTSCMRCMVSQEDTQELNARPPHAMAQKKKEKKTGFTPDSFSGFTRQD
uniref:Uncharacterized protein n=1 Tax=Glossina pallidipes TaxID=7398 RepID=A0A1A9ZMD1_GLOPL